VQQPQPLLEHAPDEELGQIKSLFEYPIIDLTGLQKSLLDRNQLG
jgi:hypothetical protein